MDQNLLFSEFPVGDPGGGRLKTVVGFLEGVLALAFHLSFSLFRDTLG